MSADNERLAGSECRRATGTPAEDDRELLAKIDALPREVDPGRDLWRGVAQRIEAQRRARRRWFVGGSLAMAATVLLAVGVATSAHGTKPVPEGLAAHPPASSVAPAPAVSAPAAAPKSLVPEEDSYRAALAALAPTLAQRKAQLPEADAAKVETSLRAIETALATTRAALTEHPDDPDLRAELDAEYEQEIQTINDVLDWTTRS
jgi:hypothetical protein